MKLFIGTAQFGFKYGLNKTQIKKSEIKNIEKILKKNNITRINCLKIDVEGHEDLALLPFFKSTEKSLFPLHMVIEHTSNSIWRYKDLMGFLSQIGYKTILKTRSNTCLSLII